MRYDSDKHIKIKVKQLRSNYSKKKERFFQGKKIRFRIGKH
jgi:hypothetical protein